MYLETLKTGAPNELTILYCVTMLPKRPKSKKSGSKITAANSARERKALRRAFGIVKSRSLSRSRSASPSSTTDEPMEEEDVDERMALADADIAAQLKSSGDEGHGNDTNESEDAIRPQNNLSKLLLFNSVKDALWSYEKEKQLLELIKLPPFNLISIHQTPFAFDLLSPPKEFNASKSSMNRNVPKTEVTRKRSMREKKNKIPITEPTYCKCARSQGKRKMIACDNKSCPIEWFHFKCVGLKTEPKGEWFCPDCRGDMALLVRPKDKLQIAKKSSTGASG